MPGDSVFDAVERLHLELEEVRVLLSGPEASVRLVLTPETGGARRGPALVHDACRSSATASTASWPTGSSPPTAPTTGAPGGSWPRTTCSTRSGSRSPGSRSGAPYRSGEPVGVASLTELARDVYGADDPLRAPRGDGPFRITRTRPRRLLRLSLPFVSRADVDLARNGDELVVTVGSYRRLLTLPAGLARFRIVAARVDAGELQVRFEERRRGER